MLLCLPFPSHRLISLLSFGFIARPREPHHFALLSVSTKAVKQLTTCRSWNTLFHPRPVCQDTSSYFLTSSEEWDPTPLGRNPADPLGSSLLSPHTPWRHSLETRSPGWRGRPRPLELRGVPVDPSTFAPQDKFGSVQNPVPTVMPQGSGSVFWASVPATGKCAPSENVILLTVPDFSLGSDRRIFYQTSPRRALCNWCGIRE